MAEKINDEELKVLLSNEIRSANTYDDTELSGKRAHALEYFQGVMNDTRPMPGRSSVVSKDVADTIGWMLPGIIRVFTASDQMAIFEPARPSDEEFAKQATDYCNFVFMKDNQGYRTLWNATHDSLLLGNGIVKHWWDDKEECEYTEHSGLTEEQIAILAQEGDVEIVAQKPGAPQRVAVPDQMGNLVPIELPTYDVKIKRVTMSGRLRVECIEAEDFLLDREATTIEDARFCAHRDHVSRSDLIEMGFDRDLVMSLPVDRFSNMQEEKLAREDDARTYFNQVGHESTLLVELYECYVKVDVDGDGIAETVRAYYAGSSGAGDLLDWEVWEDDAPFSDIPCNPIPHRWDAGSVADEVIDIQRIKTVITRGYLDNTYWNNNPLLFAEEGSVVNPDMVMSPKFCGVVWLKKGAVNHPAPLPVPYVGDKMLQALQHFDNVREMRTGVSRSTMALDPEALQNQTATANQNQKDSAYSQIELIARNQAELGWRRVFKQILKLIVKHQDRPRTIRLRDEWVEMDPRSWNAGMDVTINIGLGTGSRDRDMAMLSQILNVQIMMTDRLAQGGFGPQALDMVPKINTTAIKLAESAGIKNSEQFFLDLKPEQIEQMKAQASQPQPSPEEIKGKVQLQIAQQQAQLDAQADERKAQIEQVQAQADIATQDRKLQAEMAKSEQQFAFDKEVAILEFQLQREMKMAELDMKRQMHEQQMAQQAEQHRQQMEAGVFKTMQSQEAHSQKMEAAKSKGSE